MVEKRKLFNFEVLQFILGYDPKKKEITNQQIAKILSVEPEFILDCDINQMFELCRKASVIRGLNDEKETQTEIYEENECENCKAREAEENQEFITRVRDELQGSSTH
jgi:hypothetical protein